MTKQVIVSRPTRRQFIKYGAMAAGCVALTGPYVVRGRNLNSIINFAQVGCGGKGPGDAEYNMKQGAKLIACCDVRAEAFGELREFLKQRSLTVDPDVKMYRDYRELLDKEKDIDAVTVSCPDHMHAIISASAI